MAEGFKDFAGGAVATETDLDDYLMRQSVMRFASEAARDSALAGVLTEGLVTYQKDADQFTVYSGSAWKDYGRLAGADTWTPIVAQGTNGNVVKAGGYTADYIVLGNLCFAWFAITIGNTAVFGGGETGVAVSISLPIAAASATNVPDIGAGVFSDATGAPVHRHVGLWLVTTQTVQGVADQSNNYWGIDPSLGLATNDGLRGHVVYRIA
jgi:hypothetical protein